MELVAGGVLLSLYEKNPSRSFAIDEPGKHGLNVCKLAGMARVCSE